MTAAFERHSPLGEFCQIASLLSSLGVFVIGTSWVYVAVARSNNVGGRG